MKRKSSVPCVRHLDNIPGNSIEEKSRNLSEQIERGTARTTKKFLSEVLKAARVHVSMGNSKLGKIPNFNLTPMLTCTPEACSTCGQKCYACNSYRQYPACRKAWDENTEAAMYDPEMLYEVLRLWLDVFRPAFFRIHSAGDFATIDYTMMWYELIKRNPGTRFLAYTKQWQKVRAVPFYRLSNMALKLSDWPCCAIPEDLKKLYPVAYLIDWTRPAYVFPLMTVCPGSCATCKACYDKNRTVGFIIHGFKMTPEQEQLVKDCVSKIVKIKP